MTTKTTTPLAKAALADWISLNSFIAGADEAACRELLDAELQGKRRKMFVLRIHSRLNKVRADRERIELLGRI